MKPEYEPKTRVQILGYLVEECGEVLAAAGKTLRWGNESRNPDEVIQCRICLMVCDREEMRGTHRREDGSTHVFVDSRETNREWVLRELRDLEGAIARVRRLYGEAKEPPICTCASRAGTACPACAMGLEG